MIRRDSNQESLKDVIDRMIKAYKLDTGLNQIKVQQVWEDTLGNTVNKRTDNIFLKNGTLYVTLNSSVLKDQLSFAKNEIIDKLNEKLGSQIITTLIIK